MIHPTTASYLAKSYASDRDLEAARERRLALSKTSGTPRVAGSARLTPTASFVARLVAPFRHQLAHR